MFADDIVFVGENLEEVNNRLDDLNQEVDRTKIAMTISSDVVVEVKSFKYLGLFLQRDGGFVVDVNQRIKGYKLDEMKRIIGFLL